ncbi:GntR family transcriptional regulator [Glycomyces paridis]|uniref:GntR family transcriptional regulator n=1 Tax=Glycomyces paridis TaxID=2126555 RepID=A0A4S8PFL5_9ACTN|nr:GntR family transcriptional regulator [Glycomyces paridis]THV27114.1 GntR family transcriptional regulator [Glycomyces paridis]
MADSADSRNPAYLRIAHELRNRVLSGVYPVGSYLPSQSSLADDDFKVARMTVRAAVEVLELEGLVRAIQGRGTLVLEREDVEPPPIDPTSNEAILARLNDLQAQVVRLSEQVARLERQQAQEP